MGDRARAVFFVHIYMYIYIYIYVYIWCLCFCVVACPPGCSACSYNGATHKIMCGSTSCMPGYKYSNTELTCTSEYDNCVLWRRNNSWIHAHMHTCMVLTYIRGNTQTRTQTHMVTRAIGYMRTYCMLAYSRTVSFIRQPPLSRLPGSYYFIGK